MMEDLELNFISKDAIPASLEKAQQYRLLLEPQQAESICLDILSIQPEHHEAQVVLILAMTDQFSHSGQVMDVKLILDRIEKLPEEYERLYFRGLVSERQARAMLSESMSRSFAYEYFSKAMQYFEQAEKIRPEHNDDAILRWNSCLRTVHRERLQPRPDSDLAQQEMES